MLLRPTFKLKLKKALACAGMTAAIIDETLGGLNYVLKREGVVPHGPSFTVHLEVGLRLRCAYSGPSSCTLVCSSSE